MSKLDDVFGRRYDQKLLVKTARPMKREIKDLMLELIPGDNYAPTGDQRAVEAVNAERQRMRQKIEAL